MSTAHTHSPEVTPRHSCGIGRSRRRYTRLAMVEPANPNDDPGWPRSISVLAFMIPGLMRSRLRRSGTDGLMLLRQVTMSFTLSTVLFGVVLAFMQLLGGRTVPLLAVLLVLPGLTPTIE